MFITKEQVRKIVGLNIILLVVLYVVALIMTLTGHTYFITQYYNESLQNIQNKLTEWHLIPFINAMFLTAESSIIQFYLTSKKPKLCVLLSMYIVLGLLIEFSGIPNWSYSLLLTLFYFIVPLFYKEYRSKQYLKIFIRLPIIMIITFALQYAIQIIKLNLVNNFEQLDTSLSLTFILNVEYYLALSLIVIWLVLWREGGNKQWAEDQTHGGYSQISKKKSWKSNITPTKNLTNSQKKKLRLFYTKLLITQSLGFLFVMLFPIIIGKWLEFLVVYFAFVLTRYVLGFKKSLHFKKEINCISVAAIIFWFITLVTPSMNVLLIIAILYGMGLGLLLHFTYRYKRLYLFKSVANKDRYAEFYMFFNADISEHKVRITCNHYQIDKQDTEMVVSYLCNKDKIMYIAKQNDMTEMTVNRHLDSVLETFVNSN